MGAMPEVSRRCFADRAKTAKARVGELAAGQVGRVSAAQLILLGVGRARIWRWADAGYLFRELPGVYAVGHPGRSEESDLFAAILYAGPEAALDRLTAGLWRRLVKWRTSETIHVATPRRCVPLSAEHPSNGLGRAISVRGERNFKRWPYHGIPTVPTPQIVLDLAATGDLQLVRFVLSQLDFMRRLNEPALRAVCGPGIPGTAVLREALRTPQPLFARARSPDEITLIRICEITGIPMPEINVKVPGTEITVDAFWRDRLVVVEVDGEQNHGTWRQRKLNAADELELRDVGCLVIRYVHELLGRPWVIHADLMPQLEERRGRALSSGARRPAA